MVVWTFVLQRQTGDRTVPDTSDDRTVGTLAIWQAPLDGKMWMDELPAGGRALYLGGNGYPFPTSPLPQSSSLICIQAPYMPESSGLMTKAMC